MKPDIGSDCDFCLSHLHSTPTLGGSGQNIAVMFGVEKLEWVATRRWKKIKDTYTRFDRIHERDRQTDGRMDGRHRMTA